MTSPYNDFEQLARDRVAAIVEAEIIANGARAEKHRDLLEKCLVRPVVIGCQSEADPSPAGLMPLWLVFEEPSSRGDHYFIIYDPDRGSFGIGVKRGQQAWFLEGGGRLFEMVERLSADAQ